MIGVTGATGAIGGRVARRLAARGVPQRLLVRDPARAPALDGAEIRAFGGYVDRDGLRDGCDGLDVLLLVSAHEGPDRVAEHRTAIEAAAAAGVGRIVYLSFLGAAPEATFTYARDHFHTEALLRDAGVPWTVSRQSLYLDLVPELADEDGAIRGPAGDGRLAPVLRDDVADALVALLTGEGHEGRAYDLTGPEALTLDEIATRLSTSERPLRFVDETLEEAYASRASYGAEPWLVDGWVSTYTAIAAGELATVTDDVRRLTGHEPAAVTSAALGG
jgi:uncharacterized protein YbjT (DUF2867 family)